MTRGTQDNGNTGRGNTHSIKGRENCERMGSMIWRQGCTEVEVEDAEEEEEGWQGCGNC